MDKRLAEIQKQKPKRVPMGRRQILKVATGLDEANFVYRWFNDVAERLHQALEAGYEFVPKDGLQAGDQTVESARGTESVMRKGVGMGVVAYLMRIPRPLYEEDQRAKQADVDSMEADIRKPKEGLTGKVDFGNKR